MSTSFIDQSTNVPELIGKLVDLHLPNRRTWFHRRVGSNSGYRCTGVSVEREIATTKQLKSIAFDVLFRYLLNYQKIRRIDSALTEKERLLQEVFLLRCRRKFDVAQRLEDLTDSLGSDKLNDTVKSVLSLVLALHGSSANDQCQCIGHQDNFSHVFTRSAKENSVSLPSGPSLYGDTKLIASTSTSLYMHYPTELFTLSSMDQFDLTRTTSNYSLSSSQIFLAAPGSSTFCADSCSVLNDPLTDSTTDLISGSAQNLYGALVNSHMPSLSFLPSSRMDINLDLPDLNLLCAGDSPPELHIPKFMRRHEYPSEDEGFVSHQTSAVGTPVLTPRALEPWREGVPCNRQGVCEWATLDGEWEEEMKEREEWRRIIESLDEPRRYTWEQRGRPGGAAKEKPYLTEAGDKGFDEMRLVYIQRIKLLNSSLIDLSSNQSRDDVLIDSSTLARDIRNLLLGVASQSFSFDEISQCFSIRPGLRLPGVSPEALQHACLTSVRTGTNVRCLHSFVEVQCGPRSGQQGVGPVLAAFCEGVRACLHRYHDGINSVQLQCSLDRCSGVEVLLELEQKIKKAADQIKFLAQLCMCEYEQNTASTCLEFPKGVKLLNYLYKECLMASFTPHCLLLLSLFRRAFTPYVVMIQDWTFHGQLYDVNEEFLVLADQNYLHCRDRRYWANGYQLNEGVLSLNMDQTECLESSGRSFLSEISRSVYICGKSLNLLRSCNSKHFMFDDSLDVERPQLRLSFSQMALTNLESKTETYERRMKTLAIQHSRTREEMSKRVEQAKKELIQRAAASAAKELLKIQFRIMNDKQKRQAKRKKELEDLKQQMEEHKKNREEEVKMQKAEDKATAAATGFQPGMGTYIDSKLEQQVRHQLIGYYERLTSDSVFREHRALWKVQRHQLDKKREKFLLLSAQHLGEELQRVKETSEWQKHANIANTLEICGTKSTNKPKDVCINIDDVKISVVLEDELDSRTSPDDGNGKLPQWSKSATSSRSGNLEKSQKPSDGGASNMPAPSINLPAWAQKALESEHGFLASHGYDKNEIFDDDDDDNNTSLSLAIQEAAGLNDSIQEGLRALVSINDDIEELDLVDAMNEDMRMDLQSKILLNCNTADSQEPRSHITMVSGKSCVAESEEIKSKPHLSMVPGASSSMESIEQVTRSHTATVRGKSATAETEEKIIKPHIASVEGKSTSNETTEQSVKSHIASVEGRYSTAETESKPERPHTATVLGRGSTTESEEGVVRRHVKMVEGRCAVQESKDGAAIWHRERGERFASVQLGTPPRSAERKQRLMSRYKLALPPQLRLNHSPSPIKHTARGHHGLSPVSEDLRSFQVKSRRRIGLDTSSVDGVVVDDNVSWKSHVKLSSSMNATRESDNTERSYRPMIKMNATMRATQESALDDVTDIKNRRSRFNAHNTHGHSSDSTVQRLLYGATQGEDKELGTIHEELLDKMDELIITSRIEPYTITTSSFDFISSLGESAFVLEPTQDVFSNLPADNNDNVNDDINDIRENLDVFLPAIIKRTIVSPILAQASLVNQSVVNYFVVDININDHFKALRSFLLLEDGEFAQSLSEQIFNKLAEGSSGVEILNPAYLNQVLHRAIVNSVHGDSGLSRNISFTLNRQRDKSMLESDILQALGLTYKVDWPANIVITDSQLRLYGQLFQFLLVVKRATWLLQDMFNRLKREALIHADRINEAEMRTLQLYRHRMQHFVRGLQEYVSNQVICVSWHEFQSSLSQRVNSLDELIECHNNYLNKCTTRCLLNKKAIQVQKIIRDILGRISTFNLQLSHIQWSGEGRELVANEDGSGSKVDSSYCKSTLTLLQETYDAFHQRSLFLYKVIRSLAAKGYEPHMDELLLRLNFNGFYQ